MGLEMKSCECYRVIKNHLDNYTEFDSGIAAKNDVVIESNGVGAVVASTS